MSKKTAAKPQSKTSSSKALVPSKGAQLPARLSERLFNAAGAGMETVTARDIIIPRVTALQSLSPQVSKSKPEFIKGAEKGMFCDTATGTTWDGEDGILILPVKYQLNWLEWAPRKTNKGLVQIHDTDAILGECKKDEKGKWITPDGNTVIETAQFYALNLSDDNRRIFMSFAGTQRKKAKKLMTLATNEKVEHDGIKRTAPLFYRSYLATLAIESNDEGEWFGWTFVRDKNIEELGDDLFDEAMSYLKAVQTGGAKMDETQLMREAVQETERNM